MKKLVTPILLSAVMVCFAADSAEQTISGSFFQVVIDSGFLGILIIEDTLLNFSPARRGKSAAQSSAISDFAFLEINENTETYLFNGQAISREQLPTYLNHIGKNNKETQLIIFCADNVKHADLVKALDLCRLSSLSNISIMAK